MGTGPKTGRGLGVRMQQFDICVTGLRLGSDVPSEEGSCKSELL